MAYKSREWRREWDSLPPNGRYQNSQKNQLVTDARYSGRVPETCTWYKPVREPDAVNESLEGDASANEPRDVSGDERTTVPRLGGAIAQSDAAATKAAASDGSPRHRRMKHAEASRYDGPAAAGRELLELAAGVEPAQDGGDAADH